MKPELHVADTCIRQQGLHPALRPDAAKQPRAGVNNALRSATAISGHVPVRDFLSSVYKACQGGDGDCRQLPTSLTPERVCRVVVCPVRRVTLSGQRQTDRQTEREREREFASLLCTRARRRALLMTGSPWTFGSAIDHANTVHIYNTPRTLMLLSRLITRD